MRIIAAALALSALSFAAGVVGDLSRAPPANAGVTVTLRLPPELPAHTVRAAPLPPLVGTASAQAAPIAARRPAPVPQAVDNPSVQRADAKPRTDRVLYVGLGKQDGVAAAKSRKAAQTSVLAV